MKKKYIAPCIEVIPISPETLVCASLGHDALPHATLDNVSTANGLSADVKLSGGSWDNIWD